VVPGPHDLVPVAGVALMQDGAAYVKAITVTVAELVTRPRQIAQIYTPYLPPDPAGPPPGAAALQDGGAAGRAAEKDQEYDDARVLWIDFDAQGQRFKSWRSVCNESFAEPLGCPDIEGPGGAHHLMKHMDKAGGDAKRWFTEFCRDSGIVKTDRVFHELQVLILVLYLLGTHDQVNVPSLAGGERLCRRIISIIDAHATGGTPNWRMARYYDGTAGATDAIAPSLRQWGVRRIKDEVEISGARMRGLPTTRGGDAADDDGEGGGGADAANKRGGRRGGKPTKGAPPQASVPK